MEEHERVLRQMFQRNPDNVPSAREPCMGMSYGPFGLEAQGPQPLICEGEALTAMVVLLVVDPDRPTVLEDRAVPRHAVRNRCEELRQMERRVGIMTDAEKQHLPVQIVHPTDRALRDVGWEREWIGGDPGSLRSGRREGVEVIAS
jgi:hypothetical protein